jgi:ribose 5-phosphate isomerase B
LRISFGSDERTHLTGFIEQELRSRGHQVQTVGPPAGEQLQWADVARAVAERVSTDEADMGVLCCWTGTGVSIAANKVPGVRAALCVDVAAAKNAREHNDANVLTLGARFVDAARAQEIVAAFLDATCTEERHLRRVAKITAIEESFKR